MNKIYITWGEYGDMINILINNIKKSNIIFDGVYGIKRGGLPIAVAVSNKLNIPLLDKLTLKTIIVDDISDTGKTLLKYKKYKTATLFITPWTKSIPTFYVKKIKQNKEDWVFFPYEKN